VIQYHPHGIGGICGSDARKLKKHFLLWVAQGFGVGRVPFASGSFGSLLGLLWFVVLLWPGSFWLYLAGMSAGVFVSVWLCGRAEKILSRTDPGSVVLDEIIAVPMCFAVQVLEFLHRNGVMPGPRFFFGPHAWLMTLGVFLAFRFFDIAKPWPVHKSQNLPGGWGVTLDDVLAALYVNVVVALMLLMAAHR
jgi:phosphatidylglycerophosphatase A